LAKSLTAESADVAGSATRTGSGTNASSGAVVGSGGVDVGDKDGGEGGLEAGDGGECWSLPGVNVIVEWVVLVVLPAVEALAIAIRVPGNAGRSGEKVSVPEMMGGIVHIEGGEMDRDGTVSSSSFFSNSSSQRRFRVFFAGGGAVGEFFLRGWWQRCRRWRCGVVQAWWLRAGGLLCLRAN
jgi:hypothetical protein